MPFDGDLDDYRAWLTEQKRNKEAANSPEKTENVSRKDQRKIDAERRQKQKPLLDALKKAESAVEKFHAQQRDLETQLADMEIYADSEKARLKMVLERKTQVDKALDEAELTWLDLQEQVDAYVDNADS